jgi:hypothetical protein
LFGLLLADEEVEFKIRSGAEKLETRFFTMSRSIYDISVKQSFSHLVPVGDVGAYLNSVF